jgi:hypothetical protein
MSVFGLGMQTPMGQQLEPLRYPSHWLKITSRDAHFTPARYGGYEVLQNPLTGYAPDHNWDAYADGVVLAGGATATATISAGAVNSLSLTAGGSGYGSAPAVVFQGGGGSGAAAHATLDASGTVTAIVLDAGGDVPRWAYRALGRDRGTV